MLYPYKSQWYRHGDTKSEFEFVAEDKGHFKGSCNRSACQAPGMAWWYHQDLKVYYCLACADQINIFQTKEDLRRLRYEDTDNLIVPVSSPVHPHHADDLEWGRKVQTAFDNACLVRNRNKAIMDCLMFLHYDPCEDVRTSLRDLISRPVARPGYTLLDTSPSHVNDVTKLIDYLVSVTSTKSA